MNRPSVVIDASVACAWHIPHEKHPFLDGILTALQDGAILGMAPKLWIFEIHHVLPKRMRKYKHGNNVIDEALDALLDAAIELKSYLPPLAQHEDLPLIGRWAELDAITVKQFSSRVVALVRKHPKIGFYDAVYLDLAMQMRGELACLDGHLAEAAKAENVILRIPDSVYAEWCKNKETFEKRFDGGNA